jgi:iron complex transport system ATP-binding protein
MPTLSTHRLTAGIAGKVFCRDLDLTVRPGECWCILGRNGAGKTTLLHTLAGLVPALGGSVLLRGMSLARLNRRHTAQHLGVLFQDPFDPFPASVLETALAGRHPHLGFWQWEGAEDQARARTALELTGLAGIASRDVTTLSGGERQRLGIATLLVQDPDIYLLDEPTNHLDLHHQVQMLELVRAVARERDGSAVIIMHDVNLASRFADHFLLLFGNGTTLQGPRDAVVTRETLQRLYEHPLTPLDGPHGPVWVPR